MYNIAGYAAMIHDVRRVEAYRRAIQLMVAPDSVVVDIGTGLGVWAFLACQAGARKVYAIEPSAVIAVAQEMAAVNGYLDRIEFIEDISSRVTLPEKADAIVSDMSGAIPLFGQHLPSIADARKRFLKPGGALIPRRDTVWAAVVDAPAVHEKLAPSIDREWGLDMRLAWKMATNLSLNKHFAGNQMVTAPERVAILDYSAVEDPNVHSQVQWRLTRPGTGHGISLWFERMLAEGICFSTAPGEPESVYGGLFFPWPEPVRFEEGDTVQLEFRADLQSEDYIFRWNTTVSSAMQVKYKFRQSDFFAELRSPAQMRKQFSSHVPRLNEDGETDRMILDLMDGETSIEYIARELQQRFPAQFPTLEMALGRVAGISKSYSL